MLGIDLVLGVWLSHTAAYTVTGFVYASDPLPGLWSVAGTASSPLTSPMGVSAVDLLKDDWVSGATSPLQVSPLLYYSFFLANGFFRVLQGEACIHLEFLGQCGAPDAYD